MLTNLKPLEKRPLGEGLSLSDVPASNPAPLAVLGHYPDPGQRLRQPPCAMTAATVLTKDKACNYNQQKKRADSSCSESRFVSTQGQEPKTDLGTLQQLIRRVGDRGGVGPQVNRISEGRGKQKIDLGKVPMGITWGWGSGPWTNHSTL